MTRLSAGAITGLGVTGSNNNQIDAKLEELAQNYLNRTYTTNAIITTLLSNANHSGKEQGVLINSHFELYTVSQYGSFRYSNNSWQVRINIVKNDGMHE